MQLGRGGGSISGSAQMHPRPPFSSHPGPHAGKSNKFFKTTQGEQGEKLQNKVRHGVRGIQSILLSLQEGREEGGREWRKNKYIIEHQSHIKLFLKIKIIKKRGWRHTANSPVNISRRSHVV